MSEHAGTFDDLTRSERFALHLLSLDLNVNELAHAMNWTVAEAQTFRNKIVRHLTGTRK